MKQSKLFQIAQSFTTDEWKKARKYVLYCTEERSEVYQLYTYLTKYRMREDAKQLNINYAHARMFPQKTRKGFQNVMSKLNQILEDFLRWEWIKRNKDEYDLALLNSLNERGLFHLFDLRADQVRKRHAKSNEINLWKDMAKLRVRHLQAFSDNPTKQLNGEYALSKTAKSLIKFSSNLSNYYLTAMLHQTQISSEQYADQIKTLLKFPRSNQSTRIGFLLDHLRLLTEKKIPQSYDILFDSLINESAFLSDDMHKAIFMSLLRYTTNEFKEGNAQSADKIMSLYEIGIESKILLVNNRLPYRRVANIINVLCACNRIDRANAFLDQYEHLIPDDHREETIRISKAQIAFYGKNYEEVIQILSTQVFNKFIHMIRVRWLLLCSYYKIYSEDVNFMEMAIRNYNNHINNNRKKLSESNYYGSLNLSKIIKALVSNASPEYLKRELANQKQIVFRTWLSEQISELTELERDSH